MNVLNFPSALRRSRWRVPAQVAWRGWLNEDAPVIGYLFKVLLACLLAMWLSLRFELDQPRTALLTVAIVMQSRSGMVFAKSYYRLLGTLVGVLVSFVLVALFAQERMLFLAYMALWIGLCTAGSMIYRNHQSYAFVLAGYTLCIVGLPATLAPEQTFAIGVTRISEIMIGLISATLVSDLVFPQRMWDVMLASVRRRFQDFSDLLRAAASQPADLVPGRLAVLRFIGDIFSLESFRASAVMENDESRLQRLRLSRMNQEFMEVSTTFHAFMQLLLRQRRQGRGNVAEALQVLLQPLSAATSLDGHSARTEHEALQIAVQFEKLRAGFGTTIETARRQLPAPLDEQARIAFETGVELLQRLTEELHAYVRTYGALAAPAGATLATAEPVSPRLEMHYDPLAVALAGFRGALALAVLAAVWILTDWRSGLEAITIGVITSTLFATAPSPTQAIRQFFMGAVLGTGLAYLCNFHWLTEAQGFLMLAIAVSPGILLAAWLTTRPERAIMGAGTFIVFLLHIGFNSAYSANPVTFMNDAVADLFAVLVAGTLYGLIDLSTSRWSRRRIAAALRNLVVSACRDPLALRRARLETAARDLVQRAGSAQRIAGEEDRAVIDWLLSTLEIGHAVIALREHLPDIRDADLAVPLHTSLEAIACLFEEPSAAAWRHAVDCIEQALDRLSDPQEAAVLSAATRRTLQSMLHFIHSALLDDNTALATSPESC